MVAFCISCSITHLHKLLNFKTAAVLQFLALFLLQSPHKQVFYEERLIEYEKHTVLQEVRPMSLYGFIFALMFIVSSHTTCQVIWASGEAHLCTDQ